MAVFHGVVMDVVHVSGQVGRIADRVFPEAPLPDASLAGALASFGQPFPSRDAAREGGFDQSPAGGEIGIAGRQCPDAVQVIREDHDGVDGERIPMPDAAKRFAQRRDVLNQQPAAAFEQGDGEEEGAARDVSTNVMRHGGSVTVAAGQPGRRNTLRYSALRGLLRRVTRVSVETVDITTRMKAAPH